MKVQNQPECCPHTLVWHHTHSPASYLPLDDSGSHYVVDCLFRMFQGNIIWNFQKYETDGDVDLFFIFVTLQKFWLSAHNGKHVKMMDRNMHFRNYFRGVHGVRLSSTVLHALMVGTVLFSAFAPTLTPLRHTLTELLQYLSPSAHKHAKE